MCLYPTLIRNPKYKANKKNGGVVPAVIDKRTLWVPIGCNVCMECRKKKAAEWKTRLNEEFKSDPTGLFVTMTYSNESYTEIAKTAPEGLSEYALDNYIYKYSVRHFLERIRKETGKSMKHWLIAELGDGETDHLHIHGLIWPRKKEQYTKEC